MDVVELIKKEGLRRGLSIKTITTYTGCVKRFLEGYAKEPKYITRKDIRQYIDKLIEKGACSNTLNVYINSFKFLLEEILCKSVLFHIKFSKVPKTLPVVLTKEETINLIDAIENPVQKLRIGLLYSAGLRVGELINLRVKDIEFSKNYGWVRKGKGRKDRLFIIAEKIKDKLQQYIIDKKLPYDSYLFPGRNGHISIRTMQENIKKAGKKAGILKNIHPHTLRHSFATHLFEDGYDLATVQSLLGHASPDTTMVYVHMAPPRMISVISPFDSLP